MKRRIFLPAFLMVITTLLYYFFVIKKNKIEQTQTIVEEAPSLEEHYKSADMEPLITEEASPKAVQQDESEPSSEKFHERKDIPLDENAEKISQMEALLHSSNPRKKEEAIYQIARLGKEGISFLEEILPQLKSKDEKLQEVSAFAIAKMGEEAVLRALPDLVPLLKSDNKEVRANAVFAIGQGNKLCEEAAPQVSALLHDKEASIVEDALYALSRLSPTYQVVGKDIKPLLSNSSAKIREEAAFTLGRMGAEAAPVYDQLEELAQKDPDIKVRKAAANSLRIINGGVIKKKPKNTSIE